MRIVFLITISLALLTPVTSAGETPLSGEWPARWERIAKQDKRTLQPPGQVPSILWAEMVQEAEDSLLAVAQDDETLEESER